MLTEDWRFFETPVIGETLDERLVRLSDDPPLGFNFGKINLGVKWGMITFN